MHRASRSRAALLAAALALAGCAGPGERLFGGGKDAEAERERPVEATSLLGRPLRRPRLEPEREAELVGDLRAAQDAVAAAPRDEEAWIWLGRRLAYLGRYRDAIDAYTEGLALHPDSHRLLRHRGHRYVTVRDLDAAVADLERAAELAAVRPDTVEPDGAPNPAGIPTATTRSSIHYHLGLARYLRGENEEALAAYRDCLVAARTHDMKVAAAYWAYLTLRRLGRDDEAALLLDGLSADLPIVENHAYHALLLHFASLRTAAEVLADAEPGSLEHATRSYGLACEHEWRGEATAAAEARTEILAGAFWPAFGYVAAEADAARHARR